MANCRLQGGRATVHERDRSNGYRTHYPEIEPYRTGRLNVSDLHEIYFEECGNPAGKPVVHLHGGPGGGSEPMHRRNFDPATYRIVSFDQRGAGKKYATCRAPREHNLASGR